MRHSLTVLVILICTGCGIAVGARPLDGDEPVGLTYTVSLPNPQTQMVEMTMEVRNVQSEVLRVAMPVWRPGRYGILDPAGTVREVRAEDGNGTALEVAKRRKSVWEVETDGASTVRVHYRIYANSLADRTRHVDDTHAFLSGESIFMYVPQRMDEPLHVHLDAPKEWRIACGLRFVEGSSDTLFAPDYHVLIDSPIEVGLHDVIEFTVADVPHEIVIWAETTEYDRDQLVEDFTKIIESQKRMWGRLPYERYVFLVHAKGGAGGGTEHLNSTIMQTSPAALEGSADSDSAYRRFLGLVSHEFFHTWNVKQLRPADLVPYDYQSENYTTLLWVAEGTTSYYDDLTLARCGLMKPDDYLNVLGRSINSFLARPGRHVQSIEESSFDAWIKFTKSTPDDANSTVSFYSHGAMVSLALDMAIRHRTENVERLDNALRMLFEHYPLIQGGYTRSDLIDMIETLTGHEFDSFFDRYVRGTDDPDFAAALAVVGLELYFDPRESDSDDDPDDDERASHASLPMRATLGVSLSGTSVRSVRIDGAAYDHGLMPGDELIAIGSDRIRSESDLDRIIRQHAPGDDITLYYARRNAFREATLALRAEPDGVWKVRRLKEPTAAQIAAYESWVWQDWPGKKQQEPDTTNQSGTR